MNTHKKDLLKLLENASISLTTKENYLDSFIKICKIGKWTPNLDALRHCDEIKDICLNLKNKDGGDCNPASKEKHFANIHAVTRYLLPNENELIDKYYNYKKTEFCDAILGYTKYKTLSPERKDTLGDFKYNDIGKIFQKVYEELPPYYDHKAFSKYLICAFYWYLPPMRINELRKLTIHNTKNHLNLQTREFSISDHKTFSIYGTKRFRCPDELFEVINYVMTQSGSFRLFPNKDDTDLLPLSKFREYMYDLFGVSMGCDLLRIAYVSQIVMVDMTAEEREKSAYIMGHSVQTQATYYNSVQAGLHPEEPEADEIEINIDLNIENDYMDFGGVKINKDLLNSLLISFTDGVMYIDKKP